MSEIEFNDMKPGTMYYAVAGELPGYFKVRKFFTTEIEAAIFRQEAIDEYSKDYRGD